MPKYTIYEQRFPRMNKATGEYVANLKAVAVTNAASGEEALTEYRRTRSVCLYPLAAAEGDHV